MLIEPIGYFSGEASYKYDVPRQGSLFAGHLGQIKLESGKNYEMALRNLDGFERIWVIFQFHKNTSWRPTTRPPIPSKNYDRVGLFASRSPYRPNPIGLSCVRLIRIEKLTLFVDECDLLDGTPIIDIKPYIPLADSFPNAKAGWVELQSQELWSVEKTLDFDCQNSWLIEKSSFDLFSFACVQLANGPYDNTRHRITLNEESGILAYRTFRINFRVDSLQKKIILENITSGYSKEELSSNEDKYADKNLHREFLNTFSHKMGAPE